MRAPRPADAPGLEGPRRVSFGEALRFWVKLGWISFGGPAGQIAIMHRELVERRRWISEERFLHALNYCMMLPGPEAQQLAVYVGWLMHRTWGGIVAGAFFVIPSIFILLGLSYVYAAYGNTALVSGLLAGFKPVVVAIVVEAVLRIGKRALRGRAHAAIAAAAFVAIYVMRVPFPVIVLGAGLVGFLGARLWPAALTAEGAGGGVSGAGKDEPVSPTPDTRHPSPFVIDDHGPPPAHTLPSRRRALRVVAVGLVLWLVPLAGLLAWRGWGGLHAQEYFFFTQAALVTFGGAYAVLAYVTQAVTGAAFNWLTPAQAVDGLALAETTPGPLIMVLQFVGFMAAWNNPAPGLSREAGAVLGALVTTYVTFLPCFIFIFVGAPYIEVIRGRRGLSGALAGVTAAVVGVILNLALVFGAAVIWPRGWAGGPDWFALVVGAAAFVALYRLKAEVLWVVLAGGLLGLAWTLLAA
ncbi:MAG TPA: chromate efflux transporter [Pyrinomonadaceae bacterium]|nr:chromate efflux transporter [Pyrinomonadaceae bacterium]